MEKFRSTNFNLVLYEEDESHKKALELITKNYDYAMICHDSDADEDGVVKKAHYHVVIRFPNAKWNTALASELNIAENYIENCRNLKNSLLYLIHFYDKDKYQYDIKDVTGTLKKRMVMFIQNEDKTESEKILEILEEIDEKDFIYLVPFVKHIANIGYWDVFRRSSHIIMRYIEEHNKNVL